MEVLKTRKIKLLSPINDQMDKISQSLPDIDQLEEVKFDSVKSNLIITYNLELITLTMIEQLLVEHGFELKKNIWEKFKTGWIHFTEQNELDNLHVKHTCCSDPQEILYKK